MLRQLSVHCMMRKKVLHPQAPCCGDEGLPSYATGLEFWSYILWLWGCTILVHNYEFDDMQFDATVLINHLS